MNGFWCRSYNEQEDLSVRQHAHVCLVKAKYNATHKGDENINKFKIVCLSTGHNYKMQVIDSYRHRYIIKKKL